MTEVLIIGAGPTGLMMACQLAIHDIPFRIIDKTEDHTNQSRAIVIHAASMELFAQMNISDQFLQLGKQVAAINFMAKTKKIHIPLFAEFGKDLTDFPFFVALEQSKTEQLLLDFLRSHGRTVERGVELVALSQDDECVRAKLRNKEGAEEVVLSKWLVGADGAKSMIRHQLDIPFGGETYPLDLFVLDCKISWQLREDELYLTFSNHSFAGFFPLPGGRCRVISFVPAKLMGQDHLSFEDINAYFPQQMQMDIKLSDPAWVSTYRAHHRYVSQFRKGRCFLAGDAAHVHSPVGAQGMNTGLQDACNLAWKLAYVIKGKASDKLLETYEDERLPFAKRLVKTIDRAFGVVVSNQPIVQFMRTRVAPYLLGLMVRVRPLAIYMFKMVSQIGVTYPRSAFTSNSSSNGLFPSRAPIPGARLPYIIFEDARGRSVNIQRLVGSEMRLFFLTQSPVQDNPLVPFPRKYPQLSLTTIPFAESSKALFRRLGIRDSGYYLVRPDLYIAYRSNSLQTEDFGKFLSGFLVAETAKTN